MKNKIIVLLSAILFCTTLGLKDAMAAAASDVACKNPCINSFEIQDGQVTSTDIADGAVTDAKITGPISSSKIQKPANVIVVAKSGGDFTSILAAIDSITPTADNPYLIKVMPGTYTENITLKSYIHLQGAGRDVTTIQAPSTSTVVIAVLSLTNVTISDFTIRGGSSGVMNVSSSPTISDNIITANSEASGIYNSLNSAPIISRNIITQNPWGIYNAQTPSPTISDNIITENGLYGILNNHLSTAKITHNRITNNGGTTYTDIYVDSTSTPNISFNVYDTITGDTGVGLYNVKSDGTPSPAP